jgi:hypothetical protein
MYSVYIHTVKENGKKYIGQCTDDPKMRWGSTGHRYKGQFFYRAISKYGWDNIRHDVIATGLTKEEANKLEIELIAKYKSNEREYGYNITPGGRDGAGSPGGKNPNAHPVVCVETGQEWECLNYCAKDMGVNPSSIRESLCNGYRCHGLHFRYAEDDNYTMNKLPRKVRCVETGQVWNSARECAEELGVNKRNIFRYCNKSRKPENGLTFEYCVV